MVQSSRFHSGISRSKKSPLLSCDKQGGESAGQNEGRSDIKNRRDSSLLNGAEEKKGVEKRRVIYSLNRGRENDAGTVAGTGKQRGGH